MVRIEHWVAHTRAGNRSLASGERARWLWKRLRAAFPRVLAVVIMPDHIHVVGAVGDQAIFRGILAGFTARFGVRFDLLPPQPAHSRAIALRMVRYVLLNPVREGLVEDPWCWAWSTLRDLGGATASPWSDPGEVAKALGVPRDRLITRLTSSADRAWPPLADASVAVASLDAARSAVAASLRVPFEATRTDPEARRSVVQLLYAVGAPPAGRLAAELGCTVRTIQRDRARRDPSLGAAMVCLQDPRLLRFE